MRIEGKSGGVLKSTAVLGLCLLLPALMGGCPEFRNSSINAIETATRGVFDAALTLMFDQLRSDEVR
jgi:hypothetical protein